nr:hypothetical protein Iba_chr09eCG13970 [Ipomoea batatas]
MQECSRGYVFPFTLRHPWIGASVARHCLHPPSLLLDVDGGGKHRRRSLSPTVKRNSVATIPSPPVILHRRGTLRVRVAVELNGTPSSVPSGCAWRRSPFSGERSNSSDNEAPVASTARGSSPASGYRGRRWREAAGEYGMAPISYLPCFFLRDEQVAKE